MFIAFSLCALAATAVGVGRVAMTAAAAEASLESARLRKEIKTARYEGDALEVQQSALAAPARVRALAGKKLSLAEPASVAYWGLESPRKPRAAAPKAAVAPARARIAKPQAPEAPETGGIGAVFSKFVDVAAGEAQILMVGDVGLASTR